MLVTPEEALSLSIGEDRKHNILVYADSMDSTSTMARDLRMNMLSPVPWLICTARQVKGYGRLGREWHSPPASSLTFTLCRSIRPFERTPLLISLLCGLCLSLTIEEFLPQHLQPDIKWPNDIQIEGKKVAGILIEARSTPSGPRFFAGIGINTGSIDFPEPLKSTACTLADYLPQSPSRGHVLERFLHHLDAQMKQACEIGTSHVVSAVTGRSSWIFGKKVTWKELGEERFGITQGLDSHCGALRVLDDCNIRRNLYVSEVTEIRGV